MALQFSLRPHLGHSLQRTSRCRWVAPRASTTSLPFPTRWPTFPSKPPLLTRLFANKSPTKPLKKAPAPPPSPTALAGPRPVPARPAVARPGLPEPATTAKPKPTAKPVPAAVPKPSTNIAGNAGAVVGKNVQTRVGMPGRRAVLAASRPAASPVSKKVASRMYAEKLAKHDHPTELYHASPAILRMMWAGWTGAAFCAGYFGLNYWSMVVYPPEGVNPFIPVLFGIICTFMGGAAFWFATGTRGVIWSIRAWPAVSTRNSAQLALENSWIFRRGLYRNIIKTADKAIKAKKPVFVEVFILQGVPLMPNARMMVLPEEVKMPFSMQALIQAGKQWRAENAESTAVKMLDAGDGIPLEHLNALQVLRMWFYNFWYATKRAMIRGGFVKVDIGNVTCKFDITAARALEDGKVMDRLLGIGPSQNLLPETSEHSPLSPEVIWGQGSGGKKYKKASGENK